MSKGRLKQLLQEKGVIVTPIYKIIEKDDKKVKVSATSPEQGEMHYRATPKRYQK